MKIYKDPWVTRESYFAKTGVYGCWIEKTTPEGRRYFECSNCGAHENKHTAVKGEYCWRCGARMKGNKAVWKQ